MSGYPLYPYKLFGPIGNHAIPITSANVPKYIISWHRFEYNNHIFPGKYSIFDWLPHFLTSKNGITLVLFWLVPTIASIIIQLVKIKNKKRIKYNNYIPEIIPNFILKFGISIFILEIFIISFLIPVSVYIPWLVNVSIFLFAFSIFDLLNSFKIKLKKYNKFAIFVFVATIPLLISFYSVKNKKLFSNFSSNFLRKPFIPDINQKEIIVNPKRWNTSFKTDINNIRVRLPIGSDQCWTTTPPCLRNEKLKDKI